MDRGIERFLNKQSGRYEKVNKQLVTFEMKGREGRTGRHRREIRRVGMR